ncbi:MAG: hypothetical protein P8014_17290 [Acidihalobacter sp.]|jgi:putative transposase|uniref:hypothetical protein n=1 Tax=Acidihalobacter sp. TaxID=1872108 RepID=UPI00307F2505
MSRPLRIELPGEFYHMTSRVDRREGIYRDDEDREAWLVQLGAVCTRFNWRVHVYCEMTSHYHFVVETPQANSARPLPGTGVLLDSDNDCHLRFHLYVSIMVYFMTSTRS